MKDFFRFVVRALPFTAGLILCLTALTYLVEFTDYGAEEVFITFVGIATIGIPTLLYGIRALSNQSAQSLNAPSSQPRS